MNGLKLQPDFGSAELLQKDLKRERASASANILNADHVMQPAAACDSLAQMKKMRMVCS